MSRHASHNATSVSHSHFTASMATRAGHCNAQGGEGKPATTENARRDSGDNGGDAQDIQGTADAVICGVEIHRRTIRRFTAWSSVGSLGQQLAGGMGDGGISRFAACRKGRGIARPGRALASRLPLAFAMVNDVAE
jgi:hypothetical protein